MPIIQFNRSSRPSFPAAKLALAPDVGTPTVVERPAAVDLTGKRKVWFIIGRGRIGKTTLTRWLVETIEGRGVEKLVVAAVDPVNRTLRNFVEGVAEPPSADPSEVKDWLWDLLQHVEHGKLNTLIDLGGGDTALSALLRETPDLAGMLSENGVEPVAVHVVGTDQHDLSPLALAESQGFQPKATAIVLNEGLGRREKFDPIFVHPTFQAAIGRGGVQLWMPILTPDVARRCDAEGWQYRNVRSLGGPFAASAVHNWLRRMGDEFAPVQSWLPE
jgi:hypothetical protein